MSVDAPFCPNATRFLMKVKNKFDMGDTGMFISRDRKTGTKELVICNKTIYINTFSIKCLDIFECSHVNAHP